MKEKKNSKAWISCGPWSCRKGIRGEEDRFGVDRERRGEGGPWLWLLIAENKRL
jgi:hypothetical protein